MSRPGPLAGSDRFLLAGAQRHAVEQFRMRRHEGWIGIERRGRPLRHTLSDVVALCVLSKAVEDHGSGR